MSTTSVEQTKTTVRDGLGSGASPPTGAKQSSTGDRLYRVVWRWHFYAGMIIAIPLIVVAATGALYIFKDELEGAIYPGVTYVEPAAERVAYEQQKAAAIAASPATPRIIFMQVFADPRRATSFVMAGTTSQYSYVDPYRGKYLGAIESGGFFDDVLALHRSLFVGTKGRIVVGFTGTASGRYLAHGYRHDSAERASAWRDPPRNDETLLKHAMAAFENIEFNAKREMRVVLREKKVGYVRAKFVSSDGQNLGGMQLQNAPQLARWKKISGATDEYLFGPLFSGAAHILLSRETTANSSVVYEFYDFDIESVAGQVRHLNLDLAQGRQNELPPTRLPQRLPATQIFLPDGITPACGASVHILPPTESKTILRGVTDGTGRVTATESVVANWWHETNQDAGAGGPALTSSVGKFMLIELPGAFGKMLHPLDATGMPLRVVLPKGTTVSGTVTVFELKVERPDGPLRQALWPNTMRTDGDGQLYLDGLETGRHTLRAVETGQSQTIDVRELTEGDAKAYDVQLTWTMRR